MGRIYTGGAEVDAVAAGVDLVSLVGTTTRDTTTKRTGAASFKFDSAVGNAAASAAVVSFAPVASTSYFFRAYMNFTNLAGSTVIIMQIDANLSVKMTSTGALQLFRGATQIGSDSAALSTASWYRIELKGVTDGSVAWSAAELQIEGSSIALASGFSQARGAGGWSIGWLAAPGASKVVYADDIAINDSTGGNQNSWPGSGKVVLLKPTADSAVGTGWTLGTGTAIAGNTGKTAVSNTPPLGVADLAAGSDVKQIRNATANANVNYDATMTTYTAAGLGSLDSVVVIDPIVATGAPVTTSAKLGTIGVASNPTIANVNLGAGGTAAAFWSGVAAGTYPTGWKISHGTITYSPSVTLGTAPVMRVTQVTSSTRIAMASFMGMYVDYSTATLGVHVRPNVVTFQGSGAPPPGTVTFANLPTGLADNDLLIAFIGCGDQDISGVVPPTGWTQAYFLNVASGAADGGEIIAVFYKRVTSAAGEPTTPAFVMTNANFAGNNAYSNGVLIAMYDDTGGGKIATVDTIATPAADVAGPTLTTPSVTPSAAGASSQSAVLSLFTQDLSTVGTAPHFAMSATVGFPTKIVDVEETTSAIVTVIGLEYQTSPAATVHTATYSGADVTNRGGATGILSVISASPPGGAEDPAPYIGGGYYF